MLEGLCLEVLCDQEVGQVLNWQSPGFTNVVERVVSVVVRVLNLQTSAQNRRRKAPAERIRELALIHHSVESGRRFADVCTEFFDIERATLITEIFSWMGALGVGRCQG
jgi:hypothetical protein